MITIVLTRYQHLHTLIPKKRQNFYPLHWDQLYPPFIVFSSFHRILLSAVLVSISQSSQYSKPKKNAVGIQLCLYDSKWKQIPWWHTNPDVWIYFYASILWIYHLFCFVFIQYYFASLQDCFFFWCYHYMWISPRMLYIQYVDMHLYSSFASFSLASSHFIRSLMDLTMNLRWNSSYFILRPPTQACLQDGYWPSEGDVKS